MKNLLILLAVAVFLVSISFMFDEPSSYLDVKQRLKAAITIRSLITPDRWAEHLRASYHSCAMCNRCVLLHTNCSDLQNAAQNLYKDTELQSGSRY